MLRSGDYSALEKLYRDGLDRARRSGNLRAQTSYLTALANTYIYLFRYADAIQTYQEARDLAHKNSDWAAEGAVAPGLSSAFMLVGDWHAARQSTRAGIDVAQRLGTPPYYVAQLKLQFARINTGSSESVAEILAAIEAARMGSNVGVESFAMEAQGWDLLGEERLRSHDLSGAESAFENAYFLRTLHVKRDIGLSYSRLGALRLAQDRLEEAERLTTLAIQHQNPIRPDISGRTLLLQKGLILMAQGRTTLGLEAIESAAERTELWRQVAPPLAQSTLIAADNLANRGAGATFIEAAAHHALATRNPVWAAKAFLAKERNRGVSLRQTAELSSVWHKKLPPAYWETLSRLRAELSDEVLTRVPSTRTGEIAERLLLIESAAGLIIPTKDFRNPASLNQFQQDLGGSELFLSFHIGPKESYLWTVGRDSFHLYELPAAIRIENAVQNFRRAVLEHQAQVEKLGEDLYTMLFGQLDAREVSHSSWVLSVEDALFDLPFAALRTKSEYLVERHSIFMTSSAISLRRAAIPEGDGTLLGVSDPIYNWADERFGSATSTIRSMLFRAPQQLNRLVASADELDQVATVWKRNKILSGQTASLSAFEKSLSEARPSVVYLATHVLEEDTSLGRRSFLAFSLDAGGKPELLGSADIAMLQVPGSLVVMTGCSSGGGNDRPGAGQLELVRAWLVAGARIVLSTNWVVEDIRGDALPAFIEYLTRSLPAAEALQRAQVEMIHSTTWQSDPAYWASFQLTGDAR